MIRYVGAQLEKGSGEEADFACNRRRTCSIKVPTQDIEWRVPEGGGGPK